MRSTRDVTRAAVTTVLTAAAILSASCATQAAEPLRWRFAAGDKYSYVVTHDMNMSMSGSMMSPMDTKMHRQMDMTWDVQQIDEEGNAVINQSVDRIRMTMNGPMGQNIEYDSQVDAPVTGMAAMIAPMFEAMTKGKTRITMSPRGQIVDVQVSEEMANALRNMPGGAAMGDVATPEGFQQMMMQGSMVLPEEPLAVGQKWSSTVEVNNPMAGKQIVETSYEYAGTKEIEGTTFAVFLPTITMQFDGDATIPLKVKDQQSSGEVLFNRVAGRLGSTKLNQQVTMDATMGGQTIEQKINQTIQIKVTANQD